MSFLAPLFFLGAMAVGGPILFHLIRRTTRERISFSSLLFLQPTPPRLTRKSRLEHLLLLLLRCLALLLLTLGFARPFFRQTAAPVSDARAGRRTVLLLDTSASLQRSGLWNEARARLTQYLREAGPNDQIALLTFDREVVSRLSFSQWDSAPVGERVALAQAAIAPLTPSWFATRTGPALIRAAEELTDTDNQASAPTRPRRIILISDLQEGARLDPLQSYEWPKGIEVIPEAIRPRTPGNAGLQLVAEALDADRGAEPTVRIRIANSPDAKREQFQVGWAAAESAGFATAPIDVYVPPGQGRMVTLLTPTHVTGLNRIILRGDDEPFDNTLYIHPPEPAGLNVLYLGNDAPTETRRPLFFLQRALPDTRRQTVQLTVRKPTDLLTRETLAAAQLIVVTDDLPEKLTEAIRARLEGGQTVLFAPTTAASGVTLGLLLHRPELTLNEVRPASYAMFGELDFRHPLLAPFADPRFSDFTRIHFWRYRQWMEPLPDAAQVAARFDSGAPAWVDVPVGRGRLLFLASGWGPDDSQFALSSKFVPWLYALLDLAGAATTPVANLSVGDAIPLPNGRTAELPIRLPDGTLTNLPTSLTQFTDTHLPGLYTFGAGTEIKTVAVNLDPAETRTAPLGTDELERLGVRLDPRIATLAAEPPPATVPPAIEAEGRQKLWRWLLLATLALLLIESIVAGRTARQIALPHAAAP